MQNGEDLMAAEAATRNLILCESKTLSAQQTATGIRRQGDMKGYPYLMCDACGKDSDRREPHRYRMYRAQA